MPLLEEPPVEQNPLESSGYSEPFEDPNGLQPQPSGSSFPDLSGLKQGSRGPGNGVGGKDYQDKLNSAPKSLPPRTEKVASITGDTNKAGLPKIPTNQEDLFKAAGTRLLGNSKAAQLVTNTLDTTQKILRTFYAGDFKAGLALIVQYRRQIMVCVLVVTIPFDLLVGFAVSQGYQLLGNANGNIPISDRNVEPGISCKEMTPQLVTTYRGKAVTLTLGGTSGKYSNEQDYPLSMLSFGEEAAKVPGYTSDWLKYYITARWPSIGISFGDPKLPKPDYGDKKNTQIFKDIAVPELAYAGKRMIIYNPKSGLAVLGVAMEYGPQPWTGYDPAHPGTPDEYNQQLGLWNGPGSRGKTPTGNYRINDPNGYIERIAGGPPAVGSAIKATEQTPIVFGFASPELQNHAPGPITCTPVIQKTSTVAATMSGISNPGNNVIDDSATGGNTVDGAVHFVQGVPGIRQYDEGDCGKASAVMVGMYYNPSNTADTTTLNGNLVNANSCNVSIAGGVNQTIDGAKDKNGKAVSFVDETKKSAVTISRIKKSIDAGDPVIISGDSSLIASSGRHFVVVVGYDNSHFYINDPYPWAKTATSGDIHIYTDHSHTSGRPLLDQQAVVNSLAGDTGYYAIFRSGD